MRLFLGVDVSNASSARENLISLEDGQEAVTGFFEVGEVGRDVSPMRVKGGSRFQVGAYAQ